MIASVMQKTLNLVPALSRCSRRNQDNSSLTHKGVSKPLEESDDMCKSTDAGDDSYQCNDSDLSTTSPDGSDMETLSQDKCMPSSETTMRLPPGLSAPYGLGAPPGLGMPGTRLNSQARAFFPSTPVPHEVVQSKVEGNPLLALQEALNKLTPQEAQVVRSLLESKEKEQTPYYNQPIAWAHTSTPTPWSNPMCSRPTSRPFAPWSPQASRAMTTKSQPQRAPAGLASRGPAAQQHEDTADTLRSNLYDLSFLDSSKILMVRKINRIGMDSAGVLEAYFSKFGTIERVMVSHSRSKSNMGQMRLRPATVGFLVMSKAEDVQAVLAYGQEHCVQGVAVSALPFQSHPVDPI